jgi:hypothetical protein
VWKTIKGIHKVNSSHSTAEPTCSDSPTEEEASTVHQKLEEYNRAQTNGEYDEPGIEIGLVLKGVSGGYRRPVTESYFIKRF